MPGVKLLQAAAVSSDLIFLFLQKKVEKLEMYISAYQAGLGARKRMTIGGLLHSSFITKATTEGLILTTKGLILMTKGSKGLKASKYFLLMTKFHLSVQPYRNFCSN